MDFNRVGLFVRVVETGSFTAAARALRIPKSSVSRGVATLEKDLGVRLLQRTTRKLHLTDAGRAYFETASRALAGLDEAASAISQLQEEPAGTIRLTASVDVGVWLLAPAIDEFLAHHPAVHLDVMLTPRNVDLVQEGFDLALRAGRLADNTLVARPVGLLRAGLFASDRYLQRRGLPGTVWELKGHSCLTFRSMESWELVGPIGVERVEVSGTVNADGFEFLRELVAQGRGIALLPLYACRHARGVDNLVRVLPGYATAGASLHLVYPSARYLPKRVALLRDHLLEALPALLVDRAIAA
jgi:DNA-binding transcriptional LysR family regulator